MLIYFLKISFLKKINDLPPNKSNFGLFNGFGQFLELFNEPIRSQIVLTKDF